MSNFTTCSTELGMSLLDATFSEEISAAINTFHQYVESAVMKDDIPETVCMQFNIFIKKIEEYVKTTKRLIAREDAVNRVKDSWKEEIDQAMNTTDNTVSKTPINLTEKFKLLGKDTTPGRSRKRAKYDLFECRNIRTAGERRISTIIRALPPHRETDKIRPIHFSECSKFIRLEGRRPATNSAPPSPSQHYTSKTNSRFPTLRLASTV